MECLLPGTERFLFRFCLGDDVIRDVARARGVVAELHRELATVGGHGAEVADVAGPSADAVL